MNKIQNKIIIGAIGFLFPLISFGATVDNSQYGTSTINVGSNGLYQVMSGLNGALTDVFVYATATPRFMELYECRRNYIPGFYEGVGASDTHFPDGANCSVVFTNGVADSFTSQSGNEYQYSTTTGIILSPGYTYLLYTNFTSPGPNAGGGRYCMTTSTYSGGGIGSPDGASRDPCSDGDLSFRLVGRISDITNDTSFAPGIGVVCPSVYTLGLPTWDTTFCNLNQFLISWVSYVRGFFLSSVEFLTAIFPFSVFDHANTVLTSAGNASSTAVDLCFTFTTSTTSGLRGNFCILPASSTAYVSSTMGLNYKDIVDDFMYGGTGIIILGILFHVVRDLRGRKAVPDSRYYLDEDENEQKNA